MAYIDLKNELPGIRGLMAYNPTYAVVLNSLAEVLLRNDNSLSRGERELIGGYVSYLNDCLFCSSVHSSMACHYLNIDYQTLLEIRTDYLNAPGVSGKMKALLAIAGKVQQSGKLVQPSDITMAINEGATELEIHDTVLIASAFCMFNRYVDGLGTWAPEDFEFYMNRAPIRAEQGYLHST